MNTASVSRKSANSGSTAVTVNVSCGIARIAKLSPTRFDYFDGERYVLDAFVVMPNHVHALVKPLARIRSPIFCIRGNRLLRKRDQRTC